MSAARLAGSCILALTSALASVGNAFGDYVNCADCHLNPPPGSAAKDYYEYFAGHQRQHSVGIDYPTLANPDYWRPTAFDGDISYFDTNGNDLVDADEVQLFGTGEKVECSSCHREHGEGPPPANPNMYLRLINASDALCRVCHHL